MVKLTTSSVEPLSFASVAIPYSPADAPSSSDVLFPADALSSSDMLSPAGALFPSVTEFPLTESVSSAPSATPGSANAVIAVPDAS